MANERHKDQAVEAFSAPKDLLNKAKIEAVRRGITKSGFIRYCLARELGYAEADALELAVHGHIRRLRESLNIKTISKKP